MENTADLSEKKFSFYKDTHIYYNMWNIYPPNFPLPFSPCNPLHQFDTYMIDLQGMAVRQLINFLFLNMIKLNRTSGDGR